MKSILDGIKMIAIQTPDGQWWKVVHDCEYCCECCLDKGPEWPFADPEGKCRYVETDPDSQKMICGLGRHFARPLSCCLNDPESQETFCKVVLEKTNDVNSLL